MWDHETIMMIVQGVGETLYMTVLSTCLLYTSKRCPSSGLHPCASFFGALGLWCGGEY